MGRHVMASLPHAARRIGNPIATPATPLISRCLAAGAVSLLALALLTVVKGGKVRAQSTPPIPSRPGDPKSESAELPNDVAKLKRLLAETHAALAAERSAHAETRSMALEALRAAVAAAQSADAVATDRNTIAAGPPTPLPAATGRPQPSGGSGSEIPSATSLAVGMTTTGNDNPRPLPAPMPFSNTPSSPVPSGNTTGSPAAPIRAKLEAGDVKAAAYAIRKRGHGPLPAGVTGQCFDVQLLNPQTGKPFSFDAERYVLAEKDQLARDAYAAFHANVVTRLPRQATYRLFLSAGASSKRFGRTRTIATSRRGLASVTYYPRLGAGFADKPKILAMPQRYEPTHLPLLRADNVREVFARGTDVSRLELLEGPVLGEASPASRTFELVMCVDWPK